MPGLPSTLSHERYGPKTAIMRNNSASRKLVRLEKAPLRSDLSFGCILQRQLAAGNTIRHTQLITTQKATS